MTGSLTEGCHARADYDISTKGREISRPPHGNLLFPAAVMASSIRGFPKSARDAELQAFAQRIAPQSPGEGSAMIGGRHFWQSDYTAYHAESHFTSLKMFSKRMTNNEICNNENLKADHTADGALYTYQSGQEYRGIFPVWDWSREPPRYRCHLGCILLKMAAISLLTGIPGTTNRVGVLGTKVKQTGLTTFVGGLSTPNGSVAMSVMDYSSASFGGGDEGGVSAQKAWFFLPTGTVALARNISGSAAPASRISTTLEQSLRFNPGGDMGGGGAVSTGMAGGAATPVSVANSSVPSGHWVHHDGRVYTPLTVPSSDDSTAGAEWLLEIGDRSGSWTEINAGLDNKTDGASLTLPVFLLEASHGAAPAGADLAYAVLPGVGPASAAGAAVTAFEAAAKVVANTAAAQAVLAAPRAGEEVLMVAAWPSPTPTTVDGGKPGTKVTVTKPATGCLLTVTTTGAATTFAASDPTNSVDGATVEFTVSRAPDSFPAVGLICVPSTD